MRSQTGGLIASLFVPWIFYIVALKSAVMIGTEVVMNCAVVESHIFSFVQQYRFPGIITWPGNPSEYEERCQSYKRRAWGL